MSQNFTFKYGKYAGRTYEWVKAHAPSYIAWAEENAPNLLKPPAPKPIEKKEIKFIDKPPQSMENNTNFYNEGPAEISKPYLKKMEELKKLEDPNKDDWSF
jgi:hypothetical protein